LEHRRADAGRDLAGSLTARQLFVLVQWDLFQVFGFKDLIAVHASQIVDPVAPHQEFGAVVFTARHRMQIIPYSNEGVHVVKPPVGLRSPISALRAF